MRSQVSPRIAATLDACIAITDAAEAIAIAASGVDDSETEAGICLGLSRLLTITAVMLQEAVESEEQ